MRTDADPGGVVVMEGFEVDLADLWRAGRVWDDHAEDLRGARERLGAAGRAVPGLGPRVGPAATAFVTAWSKAAGGHARASQGNAEAIRWARAQYVAIDAEVAADLARLMPWGLAQRLRGELGAGPEDRS